MTASSLKFGEPLHVWLLMELVSKSAPTALLFLSAMTSNNVDFTMEKQSDIQLGFERSGSSISKL